MAVDFTLKREERGNRPEAQQRCVEDGFPLMTQYALRPASSAPKSPRLFGDPFAARSDFEIGSKKLYRGTAGQGRQRMVPKKEIAVWPYIRPFYALGA